MTVARDRPAQPTVAQLPGSNWKLGTARFHRMTYGLVRELTATPSSRSRTAAFWGNSCWNERRDPNAVFSQSDDVQRRGYSSLARALSWDRSSSTPDDRPERPAASAYVAGVAKRGGLAADRAPVARVASSPNPSPVPMVWTRTPRDVAGHRVARQTGERQRVGTWLPGPAGFLVRAIRRMDRLLGVVGRFPHGTSVSTSGLPAGHYPGQPLQHFPTETDAIREYRRSGQGLDSPDGCGLGLRRGRGRRPYARRATPSAPSCRFRTAVTSSFRAADIWGEQAVRPI